MIYDVFYPLCSGWFISTSGLMNFSLWVVRRTQPSQLEHTAAIEWRGIGRNIPRPQGHAAPLLPGVADTSPNVDDGPGSRPHDG